MITKQDLARKKYINFFKCNGTRNDTHHLCITGEENHSYCNE